MQAPGLLRGAVPRKAAEAGDQAADDVQRPKLLTEGNGPLQDQLFRDAVAPRDVLIPQPTLNSPVKGAPALEAKIPGQT